MIRGLVVLRPDPFLHLFRVDMAVDHVEGADVIEIGIVVLAEEEHLIVHHGAVVIEVPGLRRRRLVQISKQSECRLPYPHPSYRPIHLDIYVCSTQSTWAGSPLLYLLRGGKARQGSSTKITGIQSRAHSPPMDPIHSITGPQGSMGWIGTPSRMVPTPPASPKTTRKQPI